jgi:virginiamycin B lyase
MPAFHRSLLHLAAVAATVLLASALAASAALAEPCGSRCAYFSAPGAAGSIAPGPDGSVWYAGPGFVGRMGPDGTLARFPAPTSPSSDITAGPDGGMWFTGPGVVGRMGTDGRVTLTRPAPANITGALAPAADGSLLLAAGGALSRVGPDGSGAGLGRLPHPGAAAAGKLVKGADGALWYTQSDPAVIGRIGPDGQSTEFPLPGYFGPRVTDIASGPDGAVWFTAPDGFRVGRISTRGRVTSFTTHWNPYSITAGPSRAIWFSMTDRGRWTVVRMSPSGPFKTYWQVPGTIAAMTAGPDGGVYMTRGDSIARLEPFMGAYVTRTRVIRVSRFSHAGYVRLFCPKLDYVFCAGSVVVRKGTRVVATAPFSQRVNDAPTTRLIFNRYGWAQLRRLGRFSAVITIAQHDQGGTSRTRTENVSVTR